MSLTEKSNQLFLPGGATQNLRFDPNTNNVSQGHNECSWIHVLISPSAASS